MENGGREPQELRIRRRRRNPDSGSILIQKAITENDPKRLTKLLGQRVKLKLTAEDVAVALMEAISQGKAECVQPLLAARADPNCVDEEGKTPIIVCMESKAGGNPFILRELLKAGSSPNKATFTTHQTALHLAAKKGYQVAVNVLLSSGARVDKADTSGNTPLIFAAKEGHFTALKMLIEHEAYPDLANKNGETPLLLAAKNGHIDCAEELLECGSDPDKRDHHGDTALMLAVKNSHMEMVEMLMSYRCDVNVQSGNSGKTILHWAVKNGDLKLIQSLLRMGAEPNIRDKDWETPFITALLNKRLDVLNLLISFKCKINVTDKHFNTGLHLAAREGIAELIPMFLKSGLDCNLKTSAGQTPLMLAAFGGHVDIVTMLLTKGANPEAMDRHRATALSYAIMSKASNDSVNNIVKILIRTGCHLDERTNLRKFLKDNNLDPGNRSSNLENRPYAPIETAFLRGRPIVFLMLLKAGCSLKDFNMQSLKHGQDWLSPVRTEFRTVLYLLKHVKTAMKRFPTLQEICRSSALRLYKDPHYKPHVIAVSPSRDITGYLRYSELDDLEKNFQKMVANSQDSTKNSAAGPSATARNSDGSSFSRMSNLRSTYSLGSSQRRRTTTNASNNSSRASASSEDDDVFQSKKHDNGRPHLGSMLPRKFGHQRSKTASVDANAGLKLKIGSGNNYNKGTESWVLNQNHHIDDNQQNVSVGKSPRLSRKSVGTPIRNKSKKYGINSPKTPPSMESMLFASPPVRDDVDPFKHVGNRDSLVSNDTGFYSEDTHRCDSPTERDLHDMKSAMAWKSFTTPFDSWDSESVDSASVASVNGSQGSRDTDLSDLSRGSTSNSINDRDTSNKSNQVAPKGRDTPTQNGTSTTPKRSKIPTLFKRPTPKSFANNHVIRASQFEEVDDDRPGLFVRSKSCRK